MRKEIVPEEIRSTLQKFTEAFGDEFITIGGWAAVAYGAKGKSLDGDAMVSYQVEGILRDSYLVEKNPRMAKSQFICEAGCDIDLYVEHQHRLRIGFDEIQAYSRKMDGLKVPCPEHLVVLKFDAWKARAMTPKGHKDKQDLLQLLAKADFRNPELLEKHLADEEMLDLLSLTKDSSLALEVCSGNAVEAKQLRLNAAKSIPSPAHKAKASPPAETKGPLIG
jgi:hypothetical protein